MPPNTSNGTAYTLFDTPLGRCGIAWTARGVARVQLPEADEARTRVRLLAGVADAQRGTPTGAVRRAVSLVTAHLAGKRADLGAIVLDMATVPAFHRRVYETARAIPSGDARSYGEIAARVGSPGAARAVGQAMRRNPFPIIVPCHRVLAAGGKPGGFSANGGLDTKARLLAIEGVELRGAPARAARPRASARAALPAVGHATFDVRTARSHLAAVDKKLARLMERVGPFRMQLRDTQTTFGALAEAIVYQQLTGKAAATIFGRVQALYPARGFGPAAVLATADAQLRACGLSGSKLLALKDLAAKTESGIVPTLRRLRTIPDDEIVERLTAVRGIGRWTVEMLLIFRLGRPDVLPVDDYGVRKGFAIAFGGDLPAPRDVTARGERWRPYRTMASWYLWRAVDSLG